jgi:hypothetical protein
MPQKACKEIYVALNDEGADVWRPVEAFTVGDGLYQIVAENPHPHDKQ